MIQYLNIPGLGNSDPTHWQTYFEEHLPNCKRILQSEWNAPDCVTWIETINDEIINHDANNIVLIGHSLGCTAIAHWYKKYNVKIRGAFLVAPSDIEQPIYTFPSTGFSPIPLDQLPFKSIVIASANDEWVSLERARFFADSWGSDFINIGDAGHINAVSGHYDWREGLEILKTL